MRAALPGSLFFLYTFLPEDRAAWLIRGVKAADNIFSGFVRGKLLDSLIIGIICFFCSSFFEFPYAPLVSVVVGNSGTPRNIPTTPHSPPPTRIATMTQKPEMPVLRGAGDGEAFLLNPPRPDRRRSPANR